MNNIPVIIYVDASFDPSKKMSAAAAIVIKGNTAWELTRSLNCKNSSDAEMEAIYMAAEFSYNYCRGEVIEIHSDCLSAINKIRGLINIKEGDKLAKETKKLLQKQSITIIKTPAHQNIHGNERADRLAKKIIKDGSRRNSRGQVKVNKIDVDDATYIYGKAFIPTARKINKAEVEDILNICASEVNKMANERILRISIEKGQTLFDRKQVNELPPLHKIPISIASKMAEIEWRSLEILAITKAISSSGENEKRFFDFREIGSLKNRDLSNLLDTSMRGAREILNASFKEIFLIAKYKFIQSAEIDGTFYFNKKELRTVSGKDIATWLHKIQEKAKKKNKGRIFRARKHKSVQKLTKRELQQNSRNNDM